MMGFPCCCLPGRLAFCDLYQRKFLQVYYMDLACDFLMFLDILVTLVTVVPKVRHSALHAVFVCLFATCLVFDKLGRIRGVSLFQNTYKKQTVSATNFVQIATLYFEHQFLWNFGPILLYQVRT